MQVTDDPRYLGRSVNLKVPQRFLCKRTVFPDYFSVSDDVFNISVINIDISNFNIPLAFRQSQMYWRHFFK